ncbi:MAG: lipoyl synthase, partial [Bacteroidota bacterium]|nr:lipoyl synthase [Bacteroidota bacterium]
MQKKRKINKTKPNWLKTKIPGGKNYIAVKNIVKKNNLHTVCQEAFCPNLPECWSNGTATFMILGDTCTRNCRFCDVKTGAPKIPDDNEPKRVANAVKLMKLKFVVLTSPTRDDIPDGGADFWAMTIKTIKKVNPNCKIELLIPDFKGDLESLQTVLDAKPDILGHNLETAESLYENVRPEANYQQSLTLLQNAKKLGAITKTGIMVGLGETEDEIIQIMRDAHRVGVRYFTLGQYLQPTKENTVVEEFVTPEKFEYYRKIGMEIGFQHVESGPLVRSS